MSFFALISPPIHLEVDRFLMGIILLMAADFSGKSCIKLPVRDHVAIQNYQVPHAG